MIRKKSVITVLLLLLFAPVSAQRVGMVLSGGGAKGLYHIGVIKALEENGIPIDYISGTSMGAIIAGLYAIGYTPDEMATVFKSKDFELWMSGKIEGQYIYYFKRRPANAAMITLRFDPRNVKRSIGHQLPAGLIPSHQLDLAFVDFFAPANAEAEGNFDRLFVPFRCIATDARAHKEVVYRGGDLGRSIRASMAIPLVFKPLREDSTLLYDGGIYNNFPWQVLEEDFSPDIMIGSKCVVGNIDPREDNALEQILALTTMYTDYELPSPQDILIEHAFEDVTTLDFSKVDYIVSRGYSDAMDAMPTVLQRISRRVDLEDLNARRVAYRASLPPLEFDRYNITGLDADQEMYLRRTFRLDHVKADSVFTFEEFRRQYFKLLSEGDIEGNYPRVTFDDSTGRFALNMRMHTKPSMKLMFGGNISSTSMNQAYVGWEYRTMGKVTNTYNFNGYFSALYTSLYVGGRTDFSFKFKLPLALEYGYYFNYFNYFRSDFGILGSRADLDFSKLKDTYFTTALSCPVSRLSVLSLRTNVGLNGFRYFQVPALRNVETMDQTRFDFLGFQLQLDRDERNYLMFPTRGIRQTMQATYTFGRERYWPGTMAPVGNDTFAKDSKQWFGGRFTREHYFPGWDWFSYGYMIDAVLTDQPSLSNQFSSNLISPGFTPTPHSHMVYLKDFRSASYLGLGLMPTFEFTPKFYLKNSVYAFLPHDMNQSAVNLKKGLRYIFDTTLVYQTPMGALSLSFAKYNATTHDNWFLTFNFGYMIFSPRGTFY